MNVRTRKTTIAVIITLLSGCAIEKIDPEKEERRKKKEMEIMYDVADIKVDPNEENALFYELPGRWRLLNSEGDCITNWHAVSISKDKKTLTLSKHEKVDSAFLVQESRFDLLNANRSVIQLQNQKHQTLWTFKQTTMLTFIVARSENQETVHIFVRCGKEGSNIGAPLIMIQKKKNR